MEKYEIQREITQDERDVLEPYAKEHSVIFWARDYKIKPVICSTVFGDGKQAIIIIPLNTRPNYYLVLIDSNVDIEHEFHDYAEECIQLLIEEFGHRDDDINDEECESDEGLPFPAVSDDCGWTWDILKNGKKITEQLKQLI